jgi:hypothetical protein
MRVLIVITLLGGAVAARGGETPLPGAPAWFIAGGGRSYQDYEGGVDASVAHSGHASAPHQLGETPPHMGSVSRPVIAMSYLVRCHRA